ncbi:antibiotic resistance protein [Mesorhizobium plurifarium]|uniref:TfuA-like protein n=1 Tax=Sinorhizobium arboris TaxID=76745 RepID=UPI0004036779|nr:TfuA-like protein [Sinorhizobium arboris]PST24708.1 antibiotic resistance protein [Mesorhizobium plurifarium]
MKVIFAGPTLHGAVPASNGGYHVWPPARQGDVHRAVTEGANVIGLIDGIYEHVPAVWHKEILFGLSQGVQIFGAASMGALRAAECAPFGMIGIGRIFEDFFAGVLEDDADVAQSHGPPELGFLPLSEPLVNVRATLSRCLQGSLLTPAEHDKLLSAAQAMFFKDRTYSRVVSACFPDSPRGSELCEILRDNNVNQKLDDAEALIQAVIDARDERLPCNFEWSFARTSLWDTMFRAD